ncbi:MAG: hypothetical protein ACQEQL_09315 [Pseudomonadota bacterium]
MQSGCAAVSAAEFCTVYQPVYSTTQDTEATRLQIDRNNAVWLEFCAAQ